MKIHLFEIKKRSNTRLNLSYNKIIFIPLKSIIKTIFVLLVILNFAFNLTIAPVSSLNVKAAQNQNEEERKILESQLSDLEDQISQYESTIEQYKKQGSNLQSEIKRLNAQVAKLNLQIKAVNLTLSNLDSEIVITKKQITQTEDKISLNKENLSQLLQTLYESDAKSLVEVLLKNPQLSDFFIDLNNLAAVQDNLRIVIGEVVEARQKLVDQKEVLALNRADAATLKSYQDAQKASVQKNKIEKDDLLKTTKGQETKYQKLLQETKKTAAEIRKQIFKILGGGELNFEKAYELAKVAEKATGIRAALILAVLDRESALGKNVGQCDYKTAMHPTRDIPIFLEIIKELNLEKNLESGIIKVSCANVDGLYGGAMGPAQFIPSTWKGYKEKISSITGNIPSSPWDNRDAFVATALYLKDAGAINDEKIAAAKYYCGSNWKRYVCLNVYGRKVVEQAEEFQDDINVLNS